MTQPPIDGRRSPVAAGLLLAARAAAGAPAPGARIPSAASATTEAVDRATVARLA